MADNRLFTLEIICPDRIFYVGEAVMVELSTTEGEIGIYKDHIPMTHILAPGVLTITLPGGKKRAALYTGFMEILQDKVTIMAEVAEWPDEIDLNRAQEAQIRAERRLSEHNPSINMVRAEAALKRSLLRQELTKKY